MIVFVYFISEVLDYPVQELVSEILTPEEVDNIRQG